jgi:hypothetical protein
VLVHEYQPSSSPPVSVRICWVGYMSNPVLYASTRSDWANTQHCSMSMCLTLHYVTGQVHNTATLCRG